MSHPRGSPNDKEPASNGGLLCSDGVSFRYIIPVSRFATGGFRRSGNPLSEVRKSTLADFKGQDSSLGTDDVPKFVPKSVPNPVKAKEASGMKKAADASRTNGSDVLCFMKYSEFLAKRRITMTRQQVRLPSA